MVPQEHITWNHEDHPKDHVNHPRITLIHDTIHRGPRLARHTVPHQYFIHTNDLYYKLPNTTNRRVTDGHTYTHEGGI